MRAIGSFTLYNLLLHISHIPAAAATAAALLPSSVLAVQSNQFLGLESPSLTSALSAPPFPPRPPRPPAPPAPTETRHLECFEKPVKSATAPDLKDCDSTMEVILHDGPGPMIPQIFSRSGAQGAHKIPLSWAVGNCRIIISSKSLLRDTQDTFRFVDIVVAAQDVLRVCVPRSKWALGGIEMIGKNKFFVAVNGIIRSPGTGNVTAYGNGTDATPMGMGTALEIALPTGVNALVPGNELDEDLALSVM